MMINNFSDSLIPSLCRQTYKVESNRRHPSLSPAIVYRSRVFMFWVCAFVAIVCWYAPFGRPLFIFRGTNVVQCALTQLHKRATRNKCFAMCASIIQHLLARLNFRIGSTTIAPNKSTSDSSFADLQALHD